MDWIKFFDASSGRAVRPLLPRVLELREDAVPGVAVDLGCGDGTESRFLASQGWRVHAFDGARDTETRVPAGLSPADAARITARRVAFEDIQALPANQLMYAGRSLPFCVEPEFPQLWSLIRGSLITSGLFVGDFFGPHDSWFGRPGMNFHSREEVEALLDGLEILELTENEGPATTPFGDKHLHILTVIARA
ncbi:MAG: class I SAM-dependent methyltransferase [Lacisediminihabitans sp.]